MSLLDIFDMSLLFRIYFLISLFLFSSEPFSQGECLWQKYILMFKIFSSRLWCTKSKSLSSVNVFISGNLFLMRRIPFSIVRMDTGSIFSRNGALDFRSVTFKIIPEPLWPERMKSPSQSPILDLALIYLGLLLIIRLPSMEDGRGFLLPYFFFNLYLCISILR